MRLSREYVDYLSKVLVERLVTAQTLEVPSPQPVVESLRQVIIEELAVEDRINDKVREYLNQYQDEIRRTGISYQEMFKKIKRELVRREKVIL